MSNAAKKLDDAPDVLAGAIVKEKRVRPSNSRKREVRGTTISVARMTKSEILQARRENTDLDELPKLPRTRAECADVPRPCPFVTCKYNLFLDVLPETGAIKLNFPDLEPEEMAPEASCVLDVADAGGATLERVGDMMNVTRERIRQMEAKTLERARKAARRVSDLTDGEGFANAGQSQLAEIGTGSGGAAPVDEDEEESTGEEEFGHRKLFTGERASDERADEDWLWSRLERRRRHRESMASGESAVFDGVPLGKRTARAVAFVQRVWAERGSGPSWSEIIGELGIQGSEGSQRAEAANALAPLRETGRFAYDRATGARVFPRARHDEEARPGAAPSPRIVQPVVGANDAGSNTSPPEDAEKGNGAPQGEEPNDAEPLRRAQAVRVNRGAPREVQASEARVRRRAAPPRRRERVQRPAHTGTAKPLSLVEAMRVAMTRALVRG